MNTLKRGSNEPDVLYLQKFLKDFSGENLNLDATFGPRTEEAVKKWQISCGLVSDGVIGPRSWEKILSTTRKSITDKDYRMLADSLGVEVAAIKAVKAVESGSMGFTKEERPIFRFEPHLFRRALKGLNQETPDGNGWSSLMKAWTISPGNALKCTSFGLFQILGSNYSLMGYSDVFEYIADSYISEVSHLKAFGEFLKSAKLVGALKKLDWASFAKGYNGPSYARFGYDKKLKEAYKKYIA